MPATIPLSYSLSCLTLLASPQVKMTPDGSRLPVDDRSGKRLPLTAGSSRRPHGPRDRRHRRRSSVSSRVVSGRYEYTRSPTTLLLVPCLAAWRRTVCMDGAATGPWLLPEPGPARPTQAACQSGAGPQAGSSDKAGSSLIGRCRQRQSCHTHPPCPSTEPSVGIRVSQLVSRTQRKIHNTLSGGPIVRCSPRFRLFCPGRIFSISTTFSLLPPITSGP